MCVCVCFCFFFFKQKTAYEMRISDWSSDVCSSDLHIGLGNFHRAHMAVYLDDLFARGEGHDWAILGAGVRPADARTRDALKAQDCLSTVIELDPEGKRARRVGAMIDFIAVDPSNGPLIAAMSRPEIRIVSLTVTEGGYFIDPATVIGRASVRGSVFPNV